MSLNHPPAVIGFYGYSQSGKTTLINTLINKLEKKNVSIAVIKNTDKSIRVEGEGKDTLTFRQSGAKATAISSTIETNFTIGEHFETDRIIEIISSISNVDLIIVEGAVLPWIPKIRIGEKPMRENTIFTFSGNIEEIEHLIDSLLSKRKEKNNENNN